jgi:hypothetical protein
MLLSIGVSDVLPFLVYRSPVPWCAGSPIQRLTG